MGNAANIEGRVKKLENLLREETGVGTGTTGNETVIRYPVRQLTLKEEVSHDDAGVPTSTVCITWKSPAGSMIPDKIKLVIGAETVELDGQTTTYRKGGYAAGDVVKVIAVAVYSTGTSSAVVAQLTLTGDGEAPETPEGFTAQGGFGTITLVWAIPDNPNHSHMEVWESVIYDNLESAERIAQAYGSEFVRSNVGVLETRWYWIRAVDTGGNKGEFVGPRSATTTAIQPEAIPDGTIEESKLVGALSQKINDSNAAIQVIEQTRTGEVEVFQQPTAPTEGMQVGDLWIDNDEAVWRYVGGQWAKQENTTVYDLLKAAISQYMVKTQTMADGKLKVAGFGLFNDSSTGSEFAILADRFYIYGQSSDGTYSNVQVFAIDTTQSPPVIGISGTLIIDGTLNGAAINAATTIQLGVMKDGVLTSGQLIIGEGGKIQIGDNIIIDGGNGTFFLSASDNQANNVYIGGGVVRISRDFGDVQPSVYLLSRLGTVNGGLTNGASGSLSGIWSMEPIAAAGFSEFATYDPAYNEASQEIIASVDSVSYSGGGVYAVSATAGLYTYGGAHAWSITQRSYWPRNYTDALPDNVYTSPEILLPNIKRVTMVFDNIRSKQTRPGSVDDNAVFDLYHRRIEIYVLGKNASTGLYTEYLVKTLGPYDIYSDLYYYASVSYTFSTPVSGVKAKIKFVTDLVTPYHRWYSRWVNCYEEVTFLGGTIYQDESSGSGKYVYGGKIEVLGIGR